MTASSSEAGALTLVLEASTAAGSVALLRGDVALESRAVSMGASREDTLFPAVQSLLTSQHIAPRDLGAIVCGSGPGSFTSLRIAAAVAKGLAHAASVPLYAVPSLLLAAASHNTPGTYLVHADALRGERYNMLVRIDDNLAVHAESAVTRDTLEGLEARASAITPRAALLSLASTASSPTGESVVPDAGRLGRVFGWRAAGEVSLDEWEPAYGRLAEAQVKWEIAHARPLPSG